MNSLLESDATLGRAFTNSLAKTVRNYTKLVHNPSAKKTRVILYDSKPYWQDQFNRFNVELELGYEIRYVQELFSADTASWAEGATAVICFVNDDTSRLALQRIHALGRAAFRLGHPKELQTASTFFLKKKPGNASIFYNNKKKAAGQLITDG